MLEHTFDRLHGAKSFPPSPDSGRPISLLGSRSGMEATEKANAELEGARLDRLEAIARMDETNGFARDGYTSATSFLVHRCGLGPGEANREVALARSLRDLPRAHQMARSGRLSVSQLEVLAQVSRKHPEQFSTDEAVLADSVSGLLLTETRRAADYWCQAHCEPDDVEETEPSRVYLSRTMSGRGRLDGDLDPEHFTVVDKALDTLISELVRTTPKQDLAPTSQLRAEALAELCRRQLDAPEMPTERGSKPNVTVVVDWDVLTGRSRSGLSEFLDGTVLTPETVQRLACDAEVCRLLTGPDGEILDMGRSVRTATPAQWKALKVRDRHCRFPGCRRPWSWCDAHHLDWWWDQHGPTDVERMVLLCRYHHSLIHQAGWHLIGEPHDLIVIRPDGSELPTRSPP
jgi:hypothetical protein